MGEDLSFVFERLPGKAATARSLIYDKKPGATETL
jgi:hypothetical protein